VKILRYLLLVSLLACGVGLFLDWAAIGTEKRANAFMHLSGPYIFVVVILVGLQIVGAIRPFRSFVNLLLLVFIPIIAIECFYYFKVILNISHTPELSFSIRVAAIGFYVTLISSIIYAIYIFVSLRNNTGE